jgi:SNF2 family DNA or RNA helicase
VTGITVERVGNRIRLEGWDGATTADRCKEVGGGRFSKHGGAHWTYPLDMTICRRLRQAFPSLTIGVELWSWAATEKMREDMLITLGKTYDADLDVLPRVAPHIAKALDSRPYQRAVIKYGSLSHAYINASQPGLGKTLESLAVLVEAECYGLHLIAAPKTSVTATWYPEVVRWMRPLGWRTYAATGDRKRRESIITQALREHYSGAENLALIVNPEMLAGDIHDRCTECPYHTKNGRLQCGKDEAETHRKEHTTERWTDFEYPGLVDANWDSATMDEVHKFLLKTNLRSRTMTRTGVGGMNLKVNPDGVKQALSGTPMRGKPMNLWGLLHWLYPDRYTSQWRWAETHFKVTEQEVTGRRGRKIKTRQVGDIVVDEKAYDRELAPIMIRHTKKEVWKDLPDKLYAGTPLDPTDETSPVAVWLDLDPKQRRVYDQMRDDAIAHLDSGRLIANGVLAEMTRLKQFALASGDLDAAGKFSPRLPSAKFDWLTEFIDQLGILDGEGDGKLVVASQFTEVIELFASALTGMGATPLTLTGKTPDRKRAAVKDEFQNGSARLILINVWAGGVSIDLDAADDLVLLDETWNPDDIEQVEDRIQRGNEGRNNATIWPLKSRGTIDEYIARAAARKDDVQKKLLDGRRGISYAKKLLGAAA